ncbi:hypothetical protein OEW28_18340 [Defluviimonas sp. WL0002]|uniref:Uncharacterized protein n=1 Tax=Albidovulum marisflavi TaxID=2984159 RepID=A0ABT2ZHJ4_9RHOB|nr:hypothetical protein [Defluviimonas sp. WL0002]MCV2870576.1 hypothetical protein [Defluviimonas sp. WL0002]
MKKTLLTAAFLTAMAAPAFATQCPSLMAEIDEAMQTTTVDDATKAQVMELYEKGKAEHESGDHAASEATLAEAKALLGI